MDERIMRGRVYGADHDDPDAGLRPGHEYAELVGGPLDGLLLDVTGWSAAERAADVLLPTEIGRCGPGGRAAYGPREHAPHRFDWRGDLP